MFKLQVKPRWRPRQMNMMKNGLLLLNKVAHNCSCNSDTTAKFTLLRFSLKNIKRWIYQHRQLLGFCVQWLYSHRSLLVIEWCFQRFLSRRWELMAVKWLLCHRGLFYTWLKDTIHPSKTLSRHKYSILYLYVSIKKWKTSAHNCLPEGDIHNH